jgi:hypothetical protein
MGKPMKVMKAMKVSKDVEKITKKSVDNGGGSKPAASPKKRPAAAMDVDTDLSFLENGKHRRAAYGRMEYALARSLWYKGSVVQVVLAPELCSKLELVTCHSSQLHVWADVGP